MSQYLAKSCLCSFRSYKQGYLIIMVKCNIGMKLILFVHCTWLGLVLGNVVVSDVLEHNLSTDTNEDLT